MSPTGIDMMRFNCGIIGLKVQVTSLHANQVRGDHVAWNPGTSFSHSLPADPERMPTPWILEEGDGVGWVLASSSRAQLYWNPWRRRERCHIACSEIGLQSITEVLEIKHPGSKESRI